MLVKKISNQIIKSILFVLLLFFFLGAGYYFNLPYALSPAFIALIFFYIGYLFAKYIEKIKWNFFIALFSLMIVIGISLINKVDMAYNSYNYISLFVLSGIFGTYLIVYFSQIIKQNRFLEHLEQKSLIIMLLHFLAFISVNTIIVSCYKLPLIHILDYPTIKDYRYWWILYTIVGVLLPLMFDKVLNNFENKMPKSLKLTFWLDRIYNKYLV